MTSNPSTNQSSRYRGGMRPIACLASIPLGLGLLTGCNTAEDAGVVAGTFLTEAPINQDILSEAELVRLANALAWKRGTSGKQALSRVQAGLRPPDAHEENLATYRAIEREHAQFLRRQRLKDFDSSNGGGGGGGGGHSH